MLTLSIKVKKNYSVGKSKEIKLNDGSTLTKNDDNFIGLIIPGIRSETCPISYQDGTISIDSDDKSSIDMSDCNQTFNNVNTVITVETIDVA